MKIRQAFVANSSSSSFVIDTRKISGQQIFKIVNHIEEAANMPEIMEYVTPGNPEWDAWNISYDVGTHTLSGFTIMDNFDMSQFLRNIGIPDDLVEWDDY